MPSRPSLGSSPTPSPPGIALAKTTPPATLPPTFAYFPRMHGPGISRHGYSSCRNGTSPAPAPSSLGYRRCHSSWAASLVDSFLGRKNMLVLSCLKMSVTSTLMAFSPNIWVYAALRFVNGFGRATIGTCAFVPSTESLHGDPLSVDVRGSHLLLYNHPLCSARITEMAPGERTQRRSSGDVKNHNHEESK
ncbi:PREDICTED: uncharacterized protein LOC104602087 [Nelumbo nucifera]|uniref:Uncharacterized protein LOC104602087 n=1 Tax=Nelumbo nucifera TaxID=4432 RepID=A0A1U8Q7T4_NELNU|nr:PREDICTED: uncharacterized protein LOC104602087 [Nelumbo nucifera]